MIDFENLIKDTQTNIPEVWVFPVSKDNLEGLKIFIANCNRMGSNNSNVEIATVSTHLWMNDFLNNYLDKLSYVTNSVAFQILKVENDVVFSYAYSTTSVSTDSLDSFFEENRWKKIVYFSVNKIVNLKDMKSYYTIKYADVSDKVEVRDNKLNFILEDGIDNN
jgi:hypothetical protein